MLAAFIIAGALLAFPLFIGSASAPTPSIHKSAVQLQPDNSTVSSQPNAIPNFFFQTPSAPNPVTLDTFAGDCTTPKTVFNLQDTDLTVCAKFTNGAAGWRAIWSNARFVAVQTSAPTTGASGSVTFTLNANSGLGDWRVLLFEPFGQTVQQVATFTVIDAANPKADIVVSKELVSSGASSGHQVLFSVR